MTKNRLSPAYAYLGFLFQQPSHGYELHQRLCEEFGYIWKVSQSQTYNILKRLQHQGYISATLVEQDKLPPRQLLHMTDKGREAFNTWLLTPTKFSVHSIRVEFITRLYFIQLFEPGKTAETINQQIDSVEAGLIKISASIAQLPEEQVFNRLALDMRIMLLDSILAWLRSCRQQFSRDHQAGDEHA